MADRPAKSPGGDLPGDLFAAETASARCLPVLLPLPLAGPLDYRLPEGWQGAPPPAGSLVRVPLGGRELNGAVWDGAPEGKIPAEKLKPLLDVHPVPPLPAALRRLVDWVAGYTLAAPGQVLRMAMSAPTAPLANVSPADTKSSASMAWAAEVAVSAVTVATGPVNWSARSRV